MMRPLEQSEIELSEKKSTKRQKNKEKGNISRKEKGKEGKKGCKVRRS